MRLWPRRRHRPAPEGVRLVYPDGRVIRCGVIRDPDGYEHGYAMWIAVPLEPLPRIAPGADFPRMEADVLPGRSILSLRAEMSAGGSL